MATFTYIPSYSSSLEQTPRVLNATFGDGYEQSTLDGINHTAKKWSLTFQNRSDTDADAIISFFKTNSTATTSFDWTDPDGEALKFKCKSWRRSYDGFEHYTVTCMFEQVFW